MNQSAGRLSVLCAVTLLGPWAAAELAAQAPLPRFRVQEIDRSLTVGYAVVLADVNKDAKPDIVVCDSNRVIWFDNANDWKLHTITEGVVKRDNVCIDLHDVDGDGDLDLALGADWQFNNTKSGGTLQWLEQGKNIDEPWKVHPILKECPTLHRIRFVQVTGDGRPELIVAPLKGRNSTQQANFMDAGTELLALSIPSDKPADEPWTQQVVTNTLHVNHNFAPASIDGGRTGLLTASYEGVWFWTPGGSDGPWEGRHLGAGHQADPKGSRGASEVKRGDAQPGRPFIATVEPFHGNYAVVYTPPDGGGGTGDKLWTRTVIDEQIKWGHAVWCVDLNRDGSDEFVLGHRDPLPGSRGPGVNVYRIADPTARTFTWEKHVLDDKGMATEDLTCGDLNGDGMVDIVAVGRASKNVRIYWNEGAGAAGASK